MDNVLFIAVWQDKEISLLFSITGTSEIYTAFQLLKVGKLREITLANTDFVNEPYTLSCIETLGGIA